jgi:hypothetical protein
VRPVRADAGSFKNPRSEDQVVAPVRELPNGSVYRRVVFPDPALVSISGVPSMSAVTQTRLVALAPAAALRSTKGMPASEYDRETATAEAPAAWWSSVFPRNRVDPPAGSLCSSRFPPAS